MKYLEINICDGCGEEKKTRNMKGLDPRHKGLTYNLCKFCDNSHETIPKIMKRNTKKYGCGDAIGLKNGNVKIVITN